MLVIREAGTRTATQPTSDHAGRACRLPLTPPSKRRLAGKLLRMLPPVALSMDSWLIANGGIAGGDKGGAEGGGIDGGGVTGGGGGDEGGGAGGARTVGVATKLRAEAEMPRVEATAVFIEDIVETDEEASLEAAEP